LFAAPRPVSSTPEGGAQDPDTSDLPLREWILAGHHQYHLCELVLRTKTIEANALLSAGPESELRYLIEAYGGDEALLRQDIASMSAFSPWGGIAARVLIKAAIGRPIFHPLRRHDVIHSNANAAHAAVA
jgi:hypothetical protein